MTNDVRDAALHWARAGFCVVPTKKHDKAPMVNTWTQYVKKKGSVGTPAAPSVQIIERWFADEQTGLGLILGATSGNAEMFEFEGRAIKEGILRDFEALADINGCGDTWRRLKLGYVEKTPSGGLHFTFRVSGGPALGNTRLAARPSTAEELATKPDQPIQVLIETRGEGGFVVIAPSRVVSNGESRWAHIPKGELGEWKQIMHGEVVTLTVEERDHLYSVARMLDSVPEYVRKEVRAREKVEGQLSPLDDFRLRTDWADILEPEGWTHVGMKSDGRDAWLRPGKDFSEGWGLSATTGNTDGHSDSLYVFSTSTDLPVGTGLSKEFVWAHYNTGGDLSEAARALREQGYGSGGAAASTVVVGDTNPFSPGFDPEAWATKHAAEMRAERAERDVPTVRPEGEGGAGHDHDLDNSGLSQEFEALDFEALEAENYVEEWVVEGFLGARRAMALYSAPKLGKSLLMLEMAARVSRGEDFLGLKTRQRTVLYIDHENDPRSDTWPRLRAMGFSGKDLENLKVLSFPVMATLDTEAGGAALVRAVAQFKAGLVIIDTVSRTIAGEENDNNTWLKFFDWTGKILKRAEIPYVRLDHSGKDETKGQRGGSAKSGDVDIICQLVGDGRKFTLKMDGSRQRLENEVIAFERRDDPLRSEPIAAPAPRPKAEDQESFDAYIKAVTLFVSKLQSNDVYGVPGTERTLAQLKALWGAKRGDAAKAAEYVDRLVKHQWLLIEQPDKSTVYVRGPRFGQIDALPENPRESTPVL